MHRKAEMLLQCAKRKVTGQRERESDKKRERTMGREKTDAVTVTYKMAAAKGAHRAFVVVVITVVVNSVITLGDD